MKHWVQRFWLPALLALSCVVLSFMTGASLQASPFVLSYSEPHGFALFWHGVFSHAAAAIIVATIVSEAVERSSRFRLETELKSLLENSVKGLTRSVFGSVYSDSVIEECINSIFSSTLVRSPFKYEVRLERVDGIDGVIRKTDIVDYKIHNSSKIDVSWSPVYMMDNNIALFNHDDGFSKPEITYVKFGEKEFSPKELMEINKKISTKDIETYIDMGVFMVKAENTLDVRIEVTKIEPDRWIAPMRLFIPTSDVRVEIDNRLGEDLVVHLSSMSRIGFGPKEFHGSSSHRWHRDLSGLILPGSGWIISWFRSNERISSIRA